MSGKSAGAFNPKVILALILFGALAFFATLYFIGSGQTGGNVNNGNAHAGGKGLNGYAAFVSHLEEEGHDVTLSRSQGGFDDYGLLVLTPTLYSDADDIEKIIRDRTYVGPTMVIVPKWLAFNASSFPGSDTKTGWVRLAGTNIPEWTSDLEQPYDFEIDESGEAPNSIGNVSGDTSVDSPKSLWTGLGYSGQLPTTSQFSTVRNRLIPLVEDTDASTLIGYADDGGYYPDLASWAGINASTDENVDDTRYPVVFVVEPDLVNNYGYASSDSAEMVHFLVDILSENGDLPVTFDLTLNGLGSQQNLLTLAITPPFLAATLCMILAMLVIGWRAFRRFGPPITEGRAIAFGKARLVKNSAGFIQRSKRLHLLSGPYADMVEQRIAKALGLRRPDGAAIDAALARRAPNAPKFSTSAARLRNATKPKDLLSAAAALRSIERMLNT